MTCAERMRSTDRGFNWFVAVWGVRETFAPIFPISSGAIRAYVRLDQRGALSR
jgi:hypothetical protein